MSLEDFITSLNDDVLMVPHADRLRGLRKRMITFFFKCCHLICSKEGKRRSRNPAVLTPGWGCPPQMFQFFYYLFWVFKQTLTHSVQTLGLKTSFIKTSQWIETCTNWHMKQNVIVHTGLILLYKMKSKPTMMWYVHQLKNTKPRSVPTTWL